MENKFITLGCRLNTFESEVIKEQLEQNNIRNKIVVNTCSVTAKAEKESLRTIKDLKKRYPGSDIIVTGCAVHTAASLLEVMAHNKDIAKVVPNKHKLSLEHFLSTETPGLGRASVLSESLQRPSELVQSRPDPLLSCEPPGLNQQSPPLPEELPRVSSQAVDQVGGSNWGASSGQESSDQGRVPKGPLSPLTSAYAEQHLVRKRDKTWVLKSPLELTGASQAEGANLASHTLEEKATLAIPKLKHFQHRTRAFVQIQQGCDHRCSFCIIHHTRGQSISLTAEKILEQISHLCDNGYQEVTLTGVDISSWQRDIFTSTPSKLGSLCKAILAKTNLKRLRLSSLDPAVVDEDLLDLVANERRFLPHLHFSLQSLNNQVLTNMGRRHSQASAVFWLERLKKANHELTLGADIIAGFPKETQGQFEDTKAALQRLGVQFLHVFPYSERLGTPAAKMKQIPHSMRKHRALELIEVGKVNQQAWFQQKVGQLEEVLVEKNNLGHARDYSLVKIVRTNWESASGLSQIVPQSVEGRALGAAAQGETLGLIKSNSLVKVLITGYTEQHLIGEIQYV